MITPPPRVARIDAWKYGSRHTASATFTASHELASCEKKPTPGSLLHRADQATFDVGERVMQFFLDHPMP